MRVYRVEREDTSGPYVGQSILPERWCYANEKLHPTPWEDGIPMDCYDGHRFGFISLDSLYRWFYNWFVVDVLIAEGYRVSIYEMTEQDCMVGERQVAFLWDEAILVSTLPLDGNQCREISHNPYID